MGIDSLPVFIMKKLREFCKHHRIDRHGKEAEGEDKYSECIRERCHFAKGKI
jgi:hypothetical protein